MVLYFVWGAEVACPQRHILIHISHDEILDLYVGESRGMLDPEIINLIGRIAERIEGA